MFDKQWIFNIKKHNEYIDFCKSKGKKSSFADEIMFKRGLQGKTGGTEMLSDPYILPDMASAVDRILSAVEDGEKIAVFGDYDADGVTATAIMYHFLQNIMEADVVSYIPDRMTEGYGISIEAIDKLSKDDVNLIITVDNGIVAFEQVEYASSLGIDVVVTDHHKCADTLPNCCAVVDPCILKEETPLNHLCGAGVAFTIIRAIADEIGVSEEIYKYIPFAMIGTLGDVVSLVGDNRIIVKYGMDHFFDYNWTGIKNLFDKVNMGKTIQNINSNFISFQIVPKLNAAGRLGNAMRAFRLLICEENEEAEELAEELICENTKRKATETEIAEKAMQKENIKTNDNDAIVIALGENWHHGVIGIVAARLTEIYKKPSFVLSLDTDVTGNGDIAKGSARSVKGFNLHKALQGCSELLEKFGGHEMAAGITIKLENIPEFIKVMNHYVKNNKDCQVPPNIEIDAVVMPNELTIDEVERICDLEPYGMGNPEPVLCVRNIRPMSCMKVGEGGKHLKIMFAAQGDDGSNIMLEGIAFSQGVYESFIKSIGSICSIACRAEINEWKGRRNVTLLINDIYDGDYNIDNNLKCVYNSDYITDRGFSPQRNILAVLYKQFLKFEDKFKFHDLYLIRDNIRKMGMICTWFEIKCGLDIFVELGLIKRVDKLTFVLVKNSEKIELAQSKIFKMVQAEV